MGRLKLCECGCLYFEIEVDDNVVKICCTDCDKVYLGDDEIRALDNA